MSNENPDTPSSASACEPFTRLARSTLGQMSPEQCLRGEALVAEQFSRPKAHRPTWLVPALAGVACSLGAALLWMQTSTARAAPLTYVVENGSLSEDRLPATVDKPARLVRFSDGTEVRVEDGAQAKVRFVTDHGAALAMTRGALHADVVHSAKAEWRFDAGPFVVRVTGTAFGLAWDPDQDRFDLRLEHGSVTVTSPVANDPIPLRAGQWLTIRMRSNEVFIRDLAGHTPSDSSDSPDSSELSAERAPEPAPTPSDSDAVLPLPAGGESPSKPPTAVVGHTWAKDLARGKAQEVVDDALRRGLAACLVEANSSELAALADAARYLRREDIARTTMLVERRRFPGSRGAVDAGLLLGRLAEADRDERQALSWFNTYLTEAPSGRYASEALGRKMAVVRRSIGASAARTVAEEYLSKFPEGTYASAARAISKSP
jgi:FecR protein